MIEPVSLAVRGTVAVGSYVVVELDGDVEVGPPGTFAMVRDPLGAAFLPRPVGLFRRPDGTPAFLVDPAYSVGALAHARAIDVLSPLGSGFDLAGARASSTLLVGAGIGATVFFGDGCRAGRSGAGRLRVPGGRRRRRCST